MPRRFDLLAIDLDGTLLDATGAVPQRNRDALHRAHDAGVRVVLCTGRSFTETRPVLSEIGLDLDAAVTVGGALVSDARSGRTLDAAPIPADACAALVGWFRAREYPVLWLHDADSAGTDGCVIAGARRHAAISLWQSWSPCNMPDVDAPPTDGRLPLRLTIVDDLPTLERVSRELLADLGELHTQNLIHVPAYRFTIIETFARGVDKWRGIRVLCDRWGIDPRRTAAIGDDVNDLALLRQAGLSAAVGNARAEVLATAAVHVAANGDGGVAEFIESHILSNDGSETHGEVREA